MLFIFCIDFTSTEDLCVHGDVLVECTCRGWPRKGGKEEAEVLKKGERVKKVGKTNVLYWVKTYGDL